VTGWERDDRGSVLLLGVGWVAVCLMAVVVLVDASAAFLQRRQLVALADAAALAGAQAIDLDAYYADGASSATRLEPGLVPARVRAQLARAGAESIDGLALDAVTSDGWQVRVQLSAPLRLPFLAAVFDGRVVAESHARLALSGR
jgi:Flp pilus assembly protein TadG